MSEGIANNKYSLLLSKYPSTIFTIATSSQGAVKETVVHWSLTSLAFLLHCCRLCFEFTSVAFFVWPASHFFSSKFFFVSDDFLLLCFCNFNCSFRVINLSFWFIKKKKTLLFWLYFALFQKEEKKKKEERGRRRRRRRRESQVLPTFHLIFVAVLCCRPRRSV